MNRWIRLGLQAAFGLALLWLWLRDQRVARAPRRHQGRGAANPIRRRGVYEYPAPEEDFGMGVIKSMARGQPVVAWNQAGPTVTVRPGTGHLAEPLAVSDFAKGIIELLESPAENQAAGERAFEWARRFDWERHIDVLERCVLEVTRSHEQVAAQTESA